jgi:acyl carrier protein
LSRYDLAAIRRQCDAGEILLAEEQREEDLGPRWHSVQRVYLGHNQVLLVLELPEAFAADFDAMQFHPALLDRAAGIAKNFLAKEGHYLPLTYKRLRINAPLQRKIYSYARFREEESPDRETITFNIVLLSEQGQALVEITGFSQKRVNDPGVEIRALADAAGGQPAGAPADAAAPREEIAPHEGAAAFERILAARIAPRVIVSARDLQAVREQTDTVVRERILEAAAAQPEPARQLHPRPNLSTTYVAPETETERTIAAAWQSVLGIDQVGIHDNFFELGGDSLIAIQVISRLERELKITIPPAVVFEGANIQALARLISPEAPDQDGYDQRQTRGEERRERMLERRKRK